MPLENSFDIPPVSNYFVHKFLSSLDVNKACGLDEISLKYLKMSANVVSPIITSIINQSILSGIFPSQWKESKITPLHKGGEPGDLNNYRITPHTTHTFIHCSTYVKEGVRVFNGYINQNIFTSMLWTCGAWWKILWWVPIVYWPVTMTKL